MSKMQVIELKKQLARRDERLTELEDALRIIRRVVSKSSRADTIGLVSVVERINTLLGAGSMSLAPFVEVRAETLTEMQVLHMEQAISLKSPVADALSWDYDEAHGVAIVQPLNAAPYVVKLPNTLFRFVAVPATKVALLRARIDADLMYQKLISPT